MTILDEALAEFNRLAEEAYGTPKGPDYDELAENVSAKFGIPTEDLRDAVVGEVIGSLGAG